MSNSWTNRLVAATVIALTPGFLASPAAAQKFECPAGMGYDFAFADPDFGGQPADGWEASIKRGKGTSATGVPALSVRRGVMRCRYQLPNGAFILLVRPFPEGAECIVRQDDYFELAWFGCE